MRKVINIVHRWCVLFKIRALETELSDNELMRQTCGYVDEFMFLIEKREEIRKELTKARGEYNALLPGGQRVIWPTI